MMPERVESGRKRDWAGRDRTEGEEPIECQMESRFEFEFEPSRVKDGSRGGGEG